MRVSLRSGGEVEVALRRYVLTDLVEAPLVARWEANALGLAGRAAVPTPELLGADVDGDRSDVPAIVMSILPGRPVWETRRGRDWVSQVGDAMLALHDIDPAALRRCDEFTPRSVGSGLTVSLPEAAIGTSSGGTAEVHP